VDFLLASEDLPRSDNRVTLARDGHLRLRHSPGDTTAARRLLHRLHAMLDRLGLHPDYLIRRRTHARPGTYQAGTCRFGTDPATSVLDVNCRVHEVDNLYVVDTSFMPSTGAVDPALTVMANAVRVGDHVLERLATRLAVAAM
jgi:choline dehydrogenase-like flavoprotein